MCRPGAPGAQLLFCSEQAGKPVSTEELATDLAPNILARAQVLSDARLRRAYDYALEHPEELMYNRMRFYNAHAYKYWQTDARAVVLGFIVLVSGVQYVNQHFVYQSVRPALSLAGSLAVIRQSENCHLHDIWVAAVGSELPAYAKAPEARWLCVCLRGGRC